MSIFIHFISRIVTGVVTLQIEETEDEKHCSGKTYQTLLITHTWIIHLKCCFMIISYVIAFDFRLLSDTISWNGTSCSPTHSGLMRDTIGDKCTVADFNSITIKGILHLVTTTGYSPGILYIRSPVGTRPRLGLKVSDPYYPMFCYCCQNEIKITLI